jgi:hypothetical protein
MSSKPQSTASKPRAGTPSPTSVEAELLAAGELAPEFYGTSRAERRLRRYRPRLVAELVRQKSSGSYEPGAHGWTAS